MPASFEVGRLDLRRKAVLKKDELNAIVFGLASFFGVVIIVWRWMLE